MLIAKIAVTGVRATSTKLGTLTSGMVGARVQFTFDSSWDGLSKTAVFRCMDITKDVLNIDSEVTIPHEVLVRSGSPLYAGVYGTNAAGDLVIPTRWATVGIVYSGADPSGDPSTERSPDVWEQLQDQINELKQQGADADAIKQAVEAYMAANPPAESDPTVPEWAKQPQKPKYTASEVGALASDELQNAVNVALAQAKDSGQFDGPAGPQGEAGPAGAPGKDYVLTDADRAEIAEQAAGLVEVPESGGIEVTGASVGQIIVVKAVDDNGKPTEWKTADLPQGGEAEWKHLQTVELTENTYSVSFNLSNIADVQEVYIVCNTKQNRTDGTTVAAFSQANVRVNNADALGGVGNFSAHEAFWRYVFAGVHISKKAGYITVEASIEGTDMAVAKPVYGTSCALKADKINNVTVQANYVFVNGAVVNGFCVGSTFECYYR